MLYFDQTASTRPYEEVLELYLHLSREVYANPSALHRLGFQAEQVTKQATRDLAALLHCLPEELVFTSGATESINYALRGYTAAHPHAGNEIITWAAEHKATLATCDYLEEQGYTVHRLGSTAEGLPDLEKLEALLSPKTALLSFSLVNNETGAIVPIEKISNLRSRLAPQAVMHADLVQAWTKLPFRLDKLGVELASFAGHKIHAPKGVGLLYIKKNLKLQPLILGGGQQNGRRSGTENPILAACLAKAAQIGQEKAPRDYTRVKELNQKLRTKLAAAPFACTINSSEQGSPYLLNVSFPGVKPETLVHALADREIYVATHSACGAKDARSHALDLLPIDEAAKISALRISLDASHTEADLDELLAALGEWVPKLMTQTKDMGLSRE